MKRDGFMLILLISSAELTAHQWVMESRLDEKRPKVPVKERERKKEREIKKQTERKIEE